ncbi:MAG TPA: TonB-dependent receptor plug domain-containing protein [Sphingomonas sp.]|nr:TonB-dependent receptor plug domain-containing protein [Sphingomonas sp.]HEX4695622.1 TonB-dependent receptor plug domain-containing protein [Sphingomonas sp.]
MALASPASAQTTSTIQGHVDGAAAGATVTLTDQNTGHQDTAKVDANGNYILVGLPPSTYRVASGEQSVIVVVPLGQTVTADLLAAESAKDIVITSSRARDVRTPAIVTNVSRFQLENLPNGDRNFLNFAALAPGVTVSPPTLGGRARQVQAGGINSDNTNTFIDGISIKNLVNHGGTLGQNLSSGNPFPASAVDQFDVQTQNFKAEFEQAGSAVISSVTKTGGNRFSGEIFGEWQPKAFISRNYYDRPGKINNSTAPYRPKPNFDTKYYGGDLGGPIIKDKLTFFLDFEGTKKTFGANDINVYPGTLTLPAAAATYAQTARSQYNGSFPATFNEKLYFGKLTYFATSQDTINLSAFIRNESNLQINGGLTTTDASTRNRNNENRYQLTWNHRGSNWLNEFVFARDAAANGSIPNVAGPSFVVTYTPQVTFTAAQPTLPGGCSVFTPGGVGVGTYICPNVGNARVLALGGTNFAQDDHQYQTLFKDNVTFFGGAHTVKLGFKLNFTKLQRLEDNNGNGTFFYDANTFTGLSGATPYAATINTAAVQPVTAKNTEIGAFIQDDWKPDEHWQISAGLRWDYESNALNENFVTPANIAAAIRAYPGWQAAGGLNPNDYISTGSNRKAFLGEFQPRLGISYDVKGDRDLVFTIGGGRYYDRSLFIDSALETIKDRYESVVTINTPPNCTLGTVGCVATIPTNVDQLRALAAMQGGEVHLLNNHTKVPYSDEFDASVRKRFGRVNTSITFSYIKSHNIYQEVVGNRLPDGTYNPGGAPIYAFNGNVYDDGIFFGSGAINQAPLIYNGTRYGSIFIGNSDGKANYAALYLQADKPYTDASGWGFSTTLTLSSSRSNDTRNGASIGDPFNFDAPTIGEQGWGNSSGLERWRFVGTGTVKLPFGFRATTFVTLSSGPSYGGVICNVPATAPGGGGCYLTNFGIYRPKGIGYKNVDFNITKTIKLPWHSELTVYLQALNAFDFVNRNYSMWGGGFQNIGGPGPTLAPDVGSVASQGRSFKVGARFKF